MTRRPALLLAGLVLIVAAAGGFRAYRARLASRYEPPVFTSPPAGPRAPDTGMLGIRIGFDRLAEVRKTMSGWGVACADRSMHTIMGEIRERKREEIRRAAERGEPDAVSGASIVSRRSSRDDNPQVRLSCDDAAAANLKDRARTATRGRVLFIFDDASAPVRHASFQRNHRSWEDAWSDYSTTRATLAARFGAPKEVETGSTTPGAPLPRYAQRAAEWSYADLRVRVSVANLGGRGFSLSESVEVPWPVRADAPDLPARAARLD